MGSSDGESAYGEKYSETLEATGFAYQTLADDASTANTFEMSRRRDNLSFEHHRVVARLPLEEQDRLLDLAEKEHLSVGALRREMRKPPAPGMIWLRTRCAHAVGGVRTVCCRRRPG